jgi:acid phosphatase
MLIEQVFGVKGIALRTAALAGMLLGLAPSAPAAGAGLPHPAHVVVVIEENHTRDEVIGSAAAPYMTALAKQGAFFTRSYAITHPSLPNYFAIFSGLTNTNEDDCPALGISTTAPNLASELIAARLSFIGYAEGLPEPGSMVCWAGHYARKHAPWVHFKNIPQKTVSLPFTAFPKDYDKLPTVSFVIPDQMNDMHDGTIAQADAWLSKNIAPLVTWAQAHDTLVVLTWDEDDRSGDNKIPTIFIGSMVKSGRYAERITHYSVLRTIEDFYGLPHAGHSGGAAPINDCWR